VTWLGLVVTILAAYRITRIITTDSITARWRDRLYRWAWVEPDEDAEYRAAWARWNGETPFPPDGEEERQVPMPRRGGGRTYVNELFNCPWCMGVWISYAMTAFWLWVVRDGAPVAVYLVVGAAVAGAQGFLASRQDA